MSTVEQYELREYSSALELAPLQLETLTRRDELDGEEINNRFAWQDRAWRREAFGNPRPFVQCSGCSEGKERTMPTVEESVVINRPKAEVFAYMQDPTKTTRYNSNLVEFDKISDGPVGKGTQYRGVAKVAGRKIAWTSEVTEWEENRHWHIRSMESPVSFEIDITLKDLEGSTHLTIHQEGASFFKGFLGKLADPVVTAIYARDVRRNGAKLKELLEA